jgi:GcrA cell cycle regulator
MQSNDWTPEQSQALRDHVARGLSFARAAAEINARFGTTFTRNAAISRGKRMGLVAPLRHEDRPPVPAKSRPRSAKSRKRPGTAPRQPAVLPSSTPTPTPDPAAKATPSPAAPVQLRCVGISPRLISFAELEPGDCRYPYGGDKDDEPIAFCGHPRRTGSSYCAPHFHLTRGVGTEAERAVGPVRLRLVDAA